MDPAPPTTTVEQLISAARQGDAAQRERLFQAGRSYLRVIARARVPDRLKQKLDASDLVQLTLLEACRDFDRFTGRSEGEWLAWLRKILSHNAADIARRYTGTDKRRAQREIAFPRANGDSQSAPIWEPAAPEPTPSEQVVCREGQLQVAAALESLADDHREVILLRNFERLAFEEIAARMQRSRPAVQMLWARALKKLQEAIDASW